MKHNVILFTLVLMAAAAVTSCKSKTPEQDAAVQVQAYVLKDTTCTVSYSYPATIQGLQDVAIYPQVSGRITAIKVIEGQYVKNGDVLIEIDDVPYRAAYDAALAQVEVAKAQLETARLTYESKKNLFDLQIISEYQLNLANNEVATAVAILGQAEASLKSASNDLSFTKVRTMGKGYIGSLPYKVGSLVGPNITTPITMVSDNSSVYADFSIPENARLEILTSEDLESYGSERAVNGLFPPLNLITNVGREFDQQGKIHSISGLISNETGSIPVRAIFPNPNGVLLSGSSAKVVLRLEESNVVLVPRTSIKEIQDKQFVFVINGDTLSQVEVKASRLNSSQWQLLPDEEGNMPLKAGDRVTMTTNRLMNGAKVEVIN